MCRYIVKFNNDIDQCFECPMCGYGLSDECSLTEHDIHDVKDTMPEWCPIEEDTESLLVEMVNYLINCMPDNSLETARKIRPDLFKWFGEYIFGDE